MSKRSQSVRLVRVRFLPATDTKGSRYSVKAFGRSVTRPTDYAFSPINNARNVLLACLDGLPVADIADVRLEGAKTFDDCTFYFAVTLASDYSVTFTEV